MLFPLRILVPLAMLVLLLCQACTSLNVRTGFTPAHEFRFDDGGKAAYFVLDKRWPKRESAQPFPTTLIFVIPGSDCIGMQRMLPAYFRGLEGRFAPTRIFILQKRFVDADADGRCNPGFFEADHPSRWIADQEEFIRSELSAAQVNGQQPQRIVIMGISEGAETVPILARRIPGVTHAVLVGNGGMDPWDTYRLQARKYGFAHAPDDIARQCAGPNALSTLEVAERSCHYWTELRGIRHTDNLLALDIPVLVAMGEEDKMVPVESARSIRDRFDQAGKVNLQLITFPETGHDFQRNRESMLPQLWEALEHWLET